MSNAGNGIRIGECISLAGGRIAVCTLQNRQCIGKSIIALVDQSGDTRRIVRCVRFELTGPQGFLKSFPSLHQIIHSVCLVAIGHNGIISQNANRCVDDQARVYHFRRIKCLCADTCTVLYENAVPAVFTSSHDKVCRNRLLSVRRPSNDNSASRIRIVFQFLCYRYSLHNGKASSFIVVQ